MTEEALKWTTADEAVSIEIVDNEEGEPQVIATDDEGDVVLAVDAAGIDEVIGLLQTARAALVKIESGDEDEEEEEEEEETP